MIVLVISRFLVKSICFLTPLQDSWVTTTQVFNLISFAKLSLKLSPRCANLHTQAVYEYTPSEPKVCLFFFWFTSLIGEKCFIFCILKIIVGKDDLKIKNM